MLMVSQSRELPKLKGGGRKGKPEEVAVAGLSTHQGKGRRDTPATTALGITRF